MLICYRHNLTLPLLILRREQRRHITNPPPNLRHQHLRDANRWAALSENSSQSVSSIFRRI